jgi:hypothetical protein
VSSIFGVDKISPSLVSVKEEIMALIIVQLINSFSTSGAHMGHLFNELCGHLITF